MTSETTEFDANGAAAKEYRARHRYEAAKGVVSFLVVALLLVLLSIVTYEVVQVKQIAEDTRDLAAQSKIQAEQNEKLLRNQDDILDALATESAASRERTREALAAIDERITISEQRTRDAINALIAELNEQGHTRHSYVDPVTGRRASSRPAQQERRSTSTSARPTPTPTPAPTPTPTPTSTCRVVDPLSGNCIVSTGGTP